MSAVGVSEPPAVPGAFVPVAEIIRLLDELEAHPGPDAEAQLAMAAALEDQAWALGDDVMRLRARLIRADLAQRSGDRAGAARAFLDVHRQAEELRSPALLARSNSHLALTYHYLGDHALALEHAINAVELLDADAAPALRLAYLIRLANALGDVGSIEAARERYLQAEQLATTTGDLPRRMLALNNRAYTEFQAGELTAAAAVVERMRTVAAALGRDLSILERDTVASIQIALGLFAAAERTLLPVSDPPPGCEVHDLAEATLTLARAQRCLGVLDRAQRSLDRSRALCEEHQLTGIQATLMAEQAELFAAAGAFEEAFHEYKRHHAAVERLRSAQQEARTHTRQVMFETAEARNNAERYREQALRDPLTGLHNRRYADDHLPAALALAAETRSSLTIALVDIDHFKRINDTLSHDVGDQVLVAVADLLRSGAAAPGSFVARMGGEEFLVVLPGAGRQEAGDRLQALRRSVGSHRWPPLTGELPVTVSIGATTTTGDHTVAHLLADADRMLYVAKNAGRDRLVMAP